MHMADALLSPVVGGAMYLASASAMTHSVIKLKKEELSEKKLPLMAVTGAFVFAAQMINFTIPGTGSSGHIGGGVLLAGILGGGPALLTIAVVLAIQCLLFADGGLLALGANIFNMGVIPCLLVYPLLFKPLLKKVTGVRLGIASVLSAVIGLQLGAFGVVLETLASGVTELPFKSFVLLMQPIHLAIGLVEGIITAGVLSFVYNTRPEVITSSIERKAIASDISVKKTVIVIAIAALITAGALSLFASSYPDGLEWSMEKVAGTTELERDGSVHEGSANVQESTALLPDYDFKAGEGNGTSVAGIVGGVVTLAVAGGAGAVISLAKRKKAAKA